MFWERITYFLERVVPVANEYKVRIACHPHDPGVPPEGYQGVTRVLGTVDGLNRFVSIHESPYHGLNFCQGTVSEMLEDPGKEIFHVIRYFGHAAKSLTSTSATFAAIATTSGKSTPTRATSIVKAIRVYQEVGYPYLLMPDHVPQAPGDSNGLQSFAFCYGYIRGLLQPLAA
jgi:mannonate dehydratase